MLVINSIYYYFRITLLSIESLIALYTTKKSILYYYTDPTVYENSCMMYISLIEALLTKYEGAEVYRALLQYWLLGHWMNRLDTGLWNSDPLDRNIYWIIGWIQGKLNKKCSEITFFTCQSWAKLRVHSKKVQRLLEEYSFLNNQQERPTP